MQDQLTKPLITVVEDHLKHIYPNHDYKKLAKETIATMGLYRTDSSQVLYQNKWNEQDVWIITYGDSVKQDGESPLKTLKQFSDHYFKDVISGIHILPFSPYSSDDGFSVINYSEVNTTLGDWSDIQAISQDYDVMGDLVVNHCSQESQWFKNFQARKNPGKEYFFEASPSDDLSQVVRPRTSPLLRETTTDDGKRYVWCTFSHDQVDLNFSNPQVFLEMVQIMRLYLNHGVRIFRLDAVAFLWKEVGTDCIHLPETHEFVRLFRALIEAHTPNAIVITETNVPNHENLSYFGNANEAHGLYNFSLPPLLLHAFVSGNSRHLKRWSMSMPPAQKGTFYFNFIASHDGIGLRPTKGLLAQKEIDELVSTMQDFGALISWRAVDNNKKEPYEINVALSDALQGTASGPDQWQQQRFLCAHAIMFALEGVPGVYIHSLLGTKNDHELVDKTQQNRSINRKKWDVNDIIDKLETPNSHHAKTLTSMKKLLAIRIKQPAFHPNAVQFTLQLSDQLFGFWRQNEDRSQSIFCIFNITDQTVSLPLNTVNLISLETWVDLVSEKQYNAIEDTIELPPCGFIWLTNKAY